MHSHLISLYDYVIKKVFLFVMSRGVSRESLCEKIRFQSSNVAFRDHCDVPFRGQMFDKRYYFQNPMMETNDGNVTFRTQSETNDSDVTFRGQIFDKRYSFTSIGLCKVNGL